MWILIFWRGGGGGGGGVSSQAKGSTSFLEEVLVPLACEDGGVITKLYYFGGLFLYIFGLFKVMVQNGNIFWDRTISDIFWVCLIFLILVWVK